MSRALLVLFVWFVLIPSTPHARGPASGSGEAPTIAPAPVVDDAALARRATENVVLASFDFDAPDGSADPQGWTSRASLDPEVSHWRVDDSSGVPEHPEFANFRGFWCGVASDEAPPGWVSPPGYGNLWNDVLESQVFTVTDSFDVRLDLGYSLEPGEDFLYLEVQFPAGADWETIGIWTGEGALTERLVRIIPGPPVADARVRLRVVTDELGSDADGIFDSRGGVFLDAIAIESPSTGTSIAHDFGSEPIGATESADGFWSTGIEPNSLVGDRAQLVDGDGVYQEDPIAPNTSNFWSFYRDAEDTYRCDLVPTQPALPRSTDPANPGALNSLNNRIESPWIALDDGSPNLIELPRLRIQTRAYLDNPLDEYVYYRPLVRWGRSGGRDVEWTPSVAIYYGTGRRWQNQAFTFDIPADAVEVQVAFQVIDRAHVEAPGDVPTICHSHTPLFDDVTIERAPERPIRVTSNEAFGPGTLRDAFERANAWPGSSRIEFALPSGLTTIFVTEDLPVLTAPVEIDATTQPGYAGTPVVELRGTGGGVFGPPRPDGPHLTGGTTLRGLALTNFAVAVQMEGSGNVIESSWIGRSRSGAISDNGTGIRIRAGAADNRIGGLGDGRENEIVGNDRGVVLRSTAGRGNDLRGNRIWNSRWAGIEFGDPGAETNDPLDADDGANGLQNFPEIRFVDPVGGRVGGVLKSAPSSNFTIEIFRSSECGNDDRGEGEERLAVVEVATDAQGVAWFQAATSSVPVVGDVVSALATDAEGNSSNFAPCFFVEPAYVVTSTADSGAGSLRERLALANAHAVGSTPSILFDLPGPGPHEIALASPLPPITRGMVIDGYSQPGAMPNSAPAPGPLNASLAVAIDGSGVFDDGLVVTGNGTHVSGLAIGGFSGAGVVVAAFDVTIEGCYLGTDASGETARPNGDAGVVTGSATSSSTVLVLGGELPEQRNVVAGNQGPGVDLRAWTSEIDGNLIGASASLAPLPNVGHGIEVNAFESRIGAAVANVIAHNAGAGIRVNPSVDAFRHRVATNVFRANGGLAIDRANGGPTLEPVDDGYAPVIEAVDVETRQIRITAPITRVAAVHVYRVATCDPSGYGEGDEPIATLVIASPDPFTTLDVTFELDAELVGGDLLTATVDHALRGTSEFGACFAMEGTAVGVFDDLLPRRHVLHENWPNPFNPRTTIGFSLERPSTVRLVVHDVAGRHVRDLLGAMRPAGTHTVVWDGTDDQGHSVASGVYVVHMHAEGWADARKITLVR